MMRRLDLCLFSLFRPALAVPAGLRPVSTEVPGSTADVHVQQSGVAGRKLRGRACRFNAQGSNYLPGNCSGKWWRHCIPDLPGTMPLCDIEAEPVGETMQSLPNQGGTAIELNQ